ncbi:MAG: glycosyltransferase [Candidatus Cloacimonetes bacterium]|nr:glycosyltransferase [Candidatus Cloacimonadota bacterium]
MMLTVVLLAFVIYGYNIYLFYQGIKNKKKVISYKKSAVSVIIAARNEEKNILHLLTSLINQSYPSNLYEIIVANDGSTDRTGSIISDFTKKHKNIILVDVKDRDKVVSPKKNALSQAIQASSNEIILTTDADCIVGSYWIEAMVSNFDENTDMIVGFSQTRINNWKSAKFIQKFEHFDFLVMLFAAAGSISSGKIYSCTGQNLAYRRKSFDEVGGFEKIKHLISGDDLNLMQLFRKAGFKINFSFLEKSFASTKPVASYTQFLNQRIRWASNTKWQFFLNPEFMLYLLSVLFVVFFPIYYIFVKIEISIILILIRIVLELIFINLGFDVFRIDKKRKSFYFAWFLFQPIYMIIVAVLGQLGFFKWKK